MAEKLTIFTPTYNRAEFLPRACEALRSQSCKDFVWLIIDDGSTDETARVVSELQNQDNGFLIQYYFKKNGGLHTGYNEAIAHAETELCMCIDSDDYITEDAVDFILQTWEKVKRQDCAGIVGQVMGVDGIRHGAVKPFNSYINLNEYDVNNRWGGDRKLVVRTDLYRSVAPMPSFEGEKNFNPQYMHILISKDYVFYSVDQALCIVDYQSSGMSAGIFRQFLNSPNSFAEYRRMKMTVMPFGLNGAIRNAIHYDSSCILAGKPGAIISRSPRKWLTGLVSPFGLLLSIYIRYKGKAS